MNSMISRPAFFEGQLLAAADLSHIVDYARAKSERHNRFLHRWGVANGLQLTTEDAENAAGNAYKRVFLGPGAAIDGNGREILVTERQELDARERSHPAKRDGCRRWQKRAPHRHLAPVGPSARHRPPSPRGPAP